MKAYLQLPDKQTEWLNGQLQHRQQPPKFLLDSSTTGAKAAFSCTQKTQRKTITVVRKLARNQMYQR
jgi:hypothetical protein